MPRSPSTQDSKWGKMAFGLCRCTCTCWSLTTSTRFRMPRMAAPVRLGLPPVCSFQVSKLNLTSAAVSGTNLVHATPCLSVSQFDPSGPLVTVGGQAIHEEDRQGGVGHHRLGRVLVHQPFPAPVWLSAKDNDITRSVRGRLDNGRDRIPRGRDYVVAHPRRCRLSPRQRQHILHTVRVPEGVASRGLQQAMGVEQADLERRLLRQGAGVAYSRCALGGAVVHDEQARPARPPVCFL